RLLRTYSSGSKAKLNAYQEDYAFLLNGLVSLYEATFELRWLDDAVSLADVMIAEFWDSQQGGFYFTGRHHEQLPARTKDARDSSIPSGNAMAVTALLRLAKLSGRSDFWEKADETLQLSAGLMRSSPLAAGQMLVALDFCLGPVDEFAVVGDSRAPEVPRALELICAPFRPNKVVAFRSSDGHPRQDKTIPLLEGKTARGPVSTYICRDYACQTPLDGVEALEAALKD